MSQQFKVGDIVIGHSFRFWPEYNGMEGEVVEEPSMSSKFDLRDPFSEVKTCIRCRIQWANGNRDTPQISNLRLKRPPEEPKSEFLPCEDYFSEWLNNVRSAEKCK